MTYKLHQTDLDAFSDAGAVALRQVVGKGDLTKLAEAIEDDIRNPGPFYHGYDSDEGRFHGNLRLWETHDTFREICCNSNLPEIASAFLRSTKINMFYDQLFVKEASMSQRTRWHNDQPYWPVRG